MERVKIFFVSLLSNQFYILCCMVYFVLTWLMIGGKLSSFIVTLITYIISITIALSPLGEAIMRFIYDARAIETKREKQYLYPIFEEVYEQAQELFPQIQKIQLYITGEMYINAFALGRKTVAVTKGAIQSLSEDELKGIIAHEIGHIVRGHTKALLITTIGNGLFTGIIVINQIALGIIEFIATMISGKNSLIGILFWLLKNMVNLLLIAFMFVIQIILAVNSRRNEYQADYFAYEIGYGGNLVEALYILYDMEMYKKLSLKEKIMMRLKDSHPHLAKRIGRLETIIDGEEIEQE